jgi:hypothetical protein
MCSLRLTIFARLCPSRHCARNPEITHLPWIRFLRTTPTLSCRHVSPLYGPVTGARIQHASSVQQLARRRSVVTRAVICRIPSLGRLSGARISFYADEYMCGSSNKRVWGAWVDDYSLLTIALSIASCHRRLDSLHDSKFLGKP